MLPSAPPCCPDPIPLDILQTIIGHVYQNHDLSTLMALATTSHQYLPLCQKLIFSRIYISAGDGTDTAGQLPLSLSSLKKLLASSPTIAKYIIELEINVTNPVLSGEELLPLLGPLTCIKTLLLTSRMDEYGLYCPDSWDHISTSMARCVENLLRKPSVTELNISHLRNVPKKIFALCPKLNHLHLTSVTFPISTSGVAKPNKFGNLFRPRLTHLGLSDFFSAMAAILQSDPEVLDLRGLKSLTVSCDGSAELMFFSQLLHKIDRLDTLQLTMDGYPKAFPKLDLMGLPAMQNIQRLDFVCHDEKSSQPETLLRLTPCLDTLKSTRKKEILKTVSIQFRTCCSVYTKVISEDLQYVDSVLIDPEFGSLDITLSITVVTEGTESTSSAMPTTNELVQHLSRLSQHPSRKLHFEFTVETTSVA